MTAIALRALAEQLRLFVPTRPARELRLDAAIALDAFAALLNKQMPIGVADIEWNLEKIHALKQTLAAQTETLEKMRAAVQLVLNWHVRTQVKDESALAIRFELSNVLALLDAQRTK